jgi:hypothetical protein
MAGRTSGVGETPSSSRMESPIERDIASPGKHLARRGLSILGTRWDQDSS